jgi:hypothetical protein
MMNSRRRIRPPRLQWVLGNLVEFVKPAEPSVSAWHSIGEQVQRSNAIIPLKIEVRDCVNVPSPITRVGRIEPTGCKSLSSLDILRKQNGIAGEHTISLAGLGDPVTLQFFCILVIPFLVVRQSGSLRGPLGGTRT